MLHKITGKLNGLENAMAILYIWHSEEYLVNIQIIKRKSDPYEKITVTEVFNNFEGIRNFLLNSNNC